MPVPLQEYASCYLFVWCVLAFVFAIGLSVLNVPRSSVFFVILLHMKLKFQVYVDSSNEKKKIVLQIEYVLTYWFG